MEDFPIILVSSIHSTEAGRKVEVVVRVQQSYEASLTLFYSAFTCTLELNALLPRCNPNACTRSRQTTEGNSITLVLSIPINRMFSS